MTESAHLALSQELQRLKTENLVLRKALLDIVENVENIGSDIDIAITDGGKMRGNVGPILGRTAARGRQALAEVVAENVIASELVLDGVSQGTGLPESGVASGPCCPGLRVRSGRFAAAPPPSHP